MVADIGGPKSSEQRVQEVLRGIRSGSRIGWDEFAERVGNAGFQVSPAAVRGYEEGRTKKVPIAYVDAVCRAFGASPTSFFDEDLDGGPGSPDEAERQLAAIRQILRGSTPSSQGRPGAPHDPESLRRRFLSAIAEYSDLQVERICDLNHETVRQYRQGQWPTRGPNASTEGKIERFLELHERRRTAAATDEGELPALVEGLIAFAEEWQNDQEFRERYPKHGWISITEDAIQQLRQLHVVRYDDEIAWLAYKRAVGYSPENADKVGLDDLGMSIDPFLSRVSASRRPGEETS
jgi:transcriptional regulator with XRE-family HTH domain